MARTSRRHCHDSLKEGGNSCKLPNQSSSNALASSAYCCLLQKTGTKIDRVRSKLGLGMAKIVVMVRGCVKVGCRNRVEVGFRTMGFLMR